MLFLAKTSFPFSQNSPSSPMVEIPVYQATEGYDPESCESLADRLTTDNPDKGWNVYACVDVRRGGGPIVWKRKLQVSTVQNKNEIVEIKK